MGGDFLRTSLIWGYVISADILTGQTYNIEGSNIEPEDPTIDIK